MLEITGHFTADLVLGALLKFGAFVFGFVMVVATLLTWLERKYSALMQNRIGPNRANFGKYTFGGLLHIVADGLKMLIKEDFVPITPNPWMFRLAPLLAFVPALTVFVAIPFGPAPAEGSAFTPFQVAPTNLGMLLVFAITSLNVYGSVLGAWASNNKWSLMGGLRISAQMISYEVAIGLTLVGVFMIYGSLDLYEIVEGQSRMYGGWLPGWGIVFQPFAFVLYLACAIAENKRAPFDVAEAESELTAGYWTEYSAMAFGVLAIAEFVEVVLIGCIGALLFLGGWHIPGLSGDGPFMIALGIGAFLGKVLLLVWLQMTIRWTLPRFRYDQIMKLGWTMLLPAALVNLVVTGVVLAFVDRF